MHLRKDFTRHTIILSFLSFITLGLSTGLLGVVWRAMHLDFDVSLDSQGVILFASTIGYLSASVLCGTLLHRYGIGRLIVVGGVIMTLCLGSVLIIESWWLLVLILLINGAGSGIIDAGLNAYAAEHFSERAMNWLHASFGVGVTITPLIMASIFDAELSWRLGYGIVAAFVAVVVLILFFTRAWWHTSASKQADTSQPAARVPIRSTLSIPIVWLLILLIVLTAGLESTPGNWIFSVFTIERGISEVDAAQWISIYWGSFTIGRIFFGAIISRVNTVILLRFCLLLALIGAGMLWWNAEAWIGFAGLTILGFAQAPLFPVLISNTPRLVGQRHAANAIGFQLAGAGIGVAAIPALAGFIAERTTLEIVPPFAFIVTLTLLAVYLISNAIASRRIAANGASV